MYKVLKEHLAEAKAAVNKPVVSDLIGVIDAVDKKIFAEKKKFGEGFIIQDSIVTAVIKNQVKNINSAYEKAVGLTPTGVSPATDVMLSTITLLKSFLPPAVEGDELRMIIQGLGASNMGQAMSLLKKQSADQGYDYDGREASTIAKGIFV